jgi:hypothetical protein
MLLEKDPWATVRMKEPREEGMANAFALNVAGVIVGLNDLQRELLDQMHRLINKKKSLITLSIGYLPDEIGSLIQNELGSYLDVSDESDAIEVRLHSHLELNVEIKLKSPKEIKAIYKAAKAKHNIKVRAMSTPESAVKAQVSANDIIEFTQAIENDFNLAMENKFLDKEHGMVPSSYSAEVLAQILSKKFNLPIGGYQPYRIELVSGIRRDGQAHRWLSIYLGEERLYCDGGYWMGDGSAKGKILVSKDYKEALKTYRLLEVNDAIEAYIASDASAVGVSEWGLRSVIDDLKSGKNTGSLSGEDAGAVSLVMARDFQDFEAIRHGEERGVSDKGDLRKVDAVVSQILKPDESRDVKPAAEDGGVALDSSMLDMQTLSGGFYFDISPQEASEFKNAKGLSFVLVKD